MKTSLINIVAFHLLTSLPHWIEVFEPYRLYILYVIQPIGILASTGWFLMMWIRFFKKK